ncbi:MAG: apolipoprotein N-acyltransferase [Candidatus Fibromonas sp.]|jgi:apolipoprotein N-acyltransferase|nr:apolipoprotein N-acyltransferase [Candidatus Fibromonas sp.]
MGTKRAILLSLVSWVLMALSFPPFPLGPGALAFLAPWFCVLKTASKKTALLSSYLGAFLFNAISIYWLYHVGDVAPPALIFPGLFLGVAFLSLFALLCAWVFIKVKDARPGKFPLVFLFPFFWAGIEVLRSKGDMSFPWLSLGLVFGNSIELVQAYALLGVFGCSAIIIASNMCLAAAILKREKKLGLAPVALAAILYLGGYGVMALEKNDAGVEDTLTVAVVQPSIHQTKKWSRAYFDSVMGQTWDLFKTLDPRDVELILFPETAIPDFINTRYKEYEFFDNYARENNAVIVAGALNRVWDVGKESKRKKKYSIYNSAFLFGLDSPAAEYRKIHLVPFSEKIPFDNIFPVINYVDLGGGNFSSGDSLSIWQPGNFSPLICYEAIYGGILREAKRNGAKFIANIVNDGWFMKSIAPYQHFNLVRAHAVENGIGIVRAANTGISAFIEPNGRVNEKTGLFEQKIIRHDISLKTRFTPYSVAGDYIEQVLFVFSLLMILAAFIIKKPPT